MSLIVAIDQGTTSTRTVAFDHDLNVINKEYLISEKALKAKQEVVLNQGKVKWNLTFQTLMFY